MAYDPTIWTDDATPISATNMNKIEQGIVTHEGIAATAILAAHVELATQAETSLGTDAARVVTPATLRGLLTSTAIASDNLRGSLDSGCSNNTITWIKKKVFTIHANGIFRVKFSIRTGNTNQAGQGQIYKNGVAYGTQRSNNTTAYVEYSEDLAFNAGDTCELWMRIGPDIGPTAYAQNFRIYFDMTRVFVFDMTAELPVSSYDVP